MAKLLRRARPRRAWGVAAMLVLAVAGRAQAPDPIVVDDQTRRVTIDGSLEEWEGARRIQLNSPAALAQPAQWQGLNDLSATLYLSYDSAHLYLGGEVLDSDLVREPAGGESQQGDAVRVYLDLDLSDNADGEPVDWLSGDAVRLFLMPLNPVRSWRVRTNPAVVGRPSQLGGSTLTGVRVACREQPGKGYTFEAVVPFHNFPQLALGTREIGVELAVDDRDGDERFQSMTLTGADPDGDAARLRVLRFGGERAPLEAGPGDGGDLYDRIRGISAFVFWPALILLAGLLCLRGWGWISRRHSALRLVGQALGIVLLVLGVFLPGWLAGIRGYGMESRLTAVSERLQTELPKMEEGTFGSYRGGERDSPFVDLMSGRAVQRKRTVSHEWLVDLAAREFGAGPQRYPFDLEKFPLRPYWIPLPAEQTEQISFSDPLQGEYLYVTLARPRFRSSDVASAVRLAMKFAEAEERETQVRELRGQLFSSCLTLGHPELEMTVQYLELGAPLESISLTALEADGLRLVGLTLIPEQEEEGLPLYLGQASLGGVETDLRGRYPEEAGIRLEPQEVQRISIDPAKARSFEKLWLFYEGEYPGPDEQQPFRGQKVCEVVVHFAGGKPEPRTVEFHHQESMLFELIGNNQDLEPRHPRASVAYRWEDDTYEQHHTLGYEEPLPEGAIVEMLEFRNLVDSYPIRFRSVVFRDSKPTVRVEPADSPLQLTDSQDQVELKHEVLDAVQGASFAIYRSGGVQETMQPSAPLSLPRGLHRQLSPGEPQRRVVSDGDARIYEAYFPLSGEGWSDAVLGVFLPDLKHGEQVRLWNRIGVVLCLLAAPVLLLLFAEAIAVLSNLRVRLMAVMTVATLVPLAILSVVLVQVLESGHESGLQGGMQQAIKAASQRLEEQQEDLRASARTWLDPLVTEIVERGPEAASETHRDALQESLEATMESQKPPDWDGGFMRLEFSGQESGIGVTAFVGDDALRTAETPLRKTPGIYLSWGIPFLGVRWEQEVPDRGICSLSVARPLDRGLLGGLSPGRGVLLCDTKGYPLSAVGGPEVDESFLTRSARRPLLMDERTAALTEVLDSGQPVIARHQAEGRRWIAVYDVLRDLEDTPRALLGVVTPDQAAVLPLDLGPVPVRTYFLSIGSLLLLLSGFLAFVVTARITKPIERLERGAQALSRGEFDVRVETDEGGQIGRLTRTFNRMARDLRGRIQDLHNLNRGIQDLTSKLDLKETITSVIGFCARHSSADRVRVLIREPERDRVEVHGGKPELLDRHAPDVVALLEAVGPMSMRLRGEPNVQDRAPRALPLRFPEFGSLVALPLVLAGRSRGAIVLLFESVQPGEVHLELLTTMAAQTAAAIENARLYLHAVEDLDTGAYVPEYFRRRVVQEVQHAQQRKRRLALLGIGLGDGERLRQSLGAGRYGELMELVATQLRRVLPPDAILCRSGDDAFQVLVPGLGKDAAVEVGRAVERQLASAELGLPSGQAMRRVSVATAVFPDEAASAEFLFHALESQRGALAPPPLRERMRDLENEGVVFQSTAMQSVFRTLERVAPTELTVLLEGETGTGKEVLANLIHRWSKRADRPLVKVHCAALSESLLQSELFGHERGAFTGAVARKIGRFELAHGGTIFLDEIGEISLDTQVKLLRVLQEREIDRVGGLHPVAVDVRVVAATNRNIREMVESGAFREDLYYRLQGMVVTVPPLRDRKVEIPGLIESFRQEAVAAGQTAVRSFHPDAMDELFQRAWPGNVRELRNAVLRAMVLAGGDQVRREDLLGILPREREVAKESWAPSAVSGAVVDAPAERVREAEAGLGAPVVLPAAPPVAVSGGALPGRLGALLRLVEDRGSITTQDYVTAAGVSKRTGLRDLTQLVELGLIERVGKRRAARYQRRRTGAAEGAATAV